MDDWQGCLSPLCQTALQAARESVIRRGGHAVTIEDFLLELLHYESLCGFLQRQGVDLDELTRTIQCEQPIVTEVGGESLLSSQLVYWFHSARELTGAPWLDWPILFTALIRSAERLREKAYVAVLELVTNWPCDELRANVSGRAQNIRLASDEASTHVVVADSGWLTLIEDVMVVLSAEPNALVWLCGARGSGKSSWLKSLISTLPGGATVVDIRRGADVLANSQPVIPVAADGSLDRASIVPALVLDNVSPADLSMLMAPQSSVARELVTSYPGPVLLISPDTAGSRAGIYPLQQALGRHLTRFPMAATGITQRLAILTAHQPMIEKRWCIELAPGLIEFAASARSRLVSSPGGMLKWVERAAARLNLFAERGPIAATELAGKADTLRRQLLVAMARQQPTGCFEQSMSMLAVERAALEVSWHERKREGRLRLLTTNDLRHELERWVAANSASGHYIEQHCQAEQYSQFGQTHPSGEHEFA